MAKLKDSHPDLYIGFTEKPNVLDEFLSVLRKLLDYCLCCLTCGCYPGNGNGFHGDAFETDLTDEERIVVKNLLKYLDSSHTGKDRYKSPTINDDRLRALCILTYSGSQELQQSAAVCFAELSDRMRCGLTEIQMEPLVVLLRSRDLMIQKAASLAVSNYALNGPEMNKSVILNSGALPPLIQLLHSENTEVQCNTCGCITTLATSDKTKQEVLSLGGVLPLLELARSPDLRVKRNATGALLNLTHLQSNRNELVSQGALPALVDVLHTDDPEIQYYSAAALSNMAVNEKHRAMMVAIGHYDVVFRLIDLLAASREKVQCQACLALRNLASDVENQLLIVQLECLPKLHTIMKDARGETLAAAVACLRNLSIHRANETQIIRETFLLELRWIVQDTLNTQAQIHASGTLRNLAAGEHITDIVESGAVEALVSSLMDSNTCLAVLAEVTAALAVLNDDDAAKARVLGSRPDRVFRRLVCLAKDCKHAEVRYNCAGTIGQLSIAALPNYILRDNSPDLVEYLQSFLSSGVPSNIHIALWTLNQLLNFSSFAPVAEESRITDSLRRAVQLEHSEAITELARNALNKIRGHGNNDDEGAAASLE